MTRSMTGYGHARWEGDGRVVQVEVRAVNGRYFRLTSRLPYELAGVEHRLEKRLRARIARGSVELRAKVEFVGARAARPLNRDALATYLAQISQVSEELDCPITVTADALASLPGVLDPEEINEGEAKELTGRVRETLERAVDALDVMRLAEGANLRAALLEHCTAIEALIGEVEANAEGILKRHKEHLIERVNRLLSDTKVRVGEADLAREIALHADRSNVCEETARVRSHIEQFRTALDEEKPIGRRLEFLAQELHREVNTMGSKVADAGVSRVVVALHGEVDKVREQVLNVE